MTSQHQPQDPGDQQRQEQLLGDDGLVDLGLRLEASCRDEPFLDWRLSDPLIIINLQSIIYRVSWEEERMSKSIYFETKLPFQPDINFIIGPLSASLTFQLMH